MTPKTSYSYRAMVVRWIDGDTVTDDGIDVGLAVAYHGEKR